MMNPRFEPPEGSARLATFVAAGLGVLGAVALAVLPVGDAGTRLAEYGNGVFVTMALLVALTCIPLALSGAKQGIALWAGAALLGLLAIQGQYGATLFLLPAIIALVVAAVLKMLSPED